MSKVYNKIVQSNTEPSKNDVWLKDGQMKTFGKEGWKPVGRSSSLDANTPIKESVDGTELVPIFDGENKAVNVKKLVKGGFEQNGDGTKFLSDDGSYKTIDITSLQTQITALEKRIAALEGATA